MSVNSVKFVKEKKKEKRDKFRQYCKKDTEVNRIQRVQVKRFGNVIQQGKRVHGQWNPEGKGGLWT